MHAPEDYDAEQAVLSACMQRLSAIPDLIEMGIELESYWTPTNQKIWLGLQDALAAAPKGADQIDPLLLHKHLRGRAPESSLVDLTQLFTLVATSHNVRWLRWAGA